MGTHLPPTRLFSMSGLVSGAGPVTGYIESGRPGNAMLLLNVLATGTSWAVALSTGNTTGSGQSSVPISGAASVSGNAAAGTGLFGYRLQNKLAKYTYYSVSGVGNPTVAAQLIGQDYFNSAELSAPSATAGNLLTEA